MTLIKFFDVFYNISQILVVIFVMLILHKNIGFWGQS